MATCPKCKDTGWILYKREAEEPFYKPGTLLDFGVRCDCKHEQKTGRND